MKTMTSEPTVKKSHVSDIDGIDIEIDGIEIDGIESSSSVVK
jgi:hypothetical protein